MLYVHPQFLAASPRPWQTSSKPISRASIFCGMATVQRLTFAAALLVCTSGASSAGPAGTSSSASSASVLGGVLKLVKW